MKLVEIKNSLAKLYYQPKESPLVLSDFVLVDDGNQKLLAQVISLKSTSQENTNCAILKFSLDISDDSFSAYSGYTPALDAKAEKASADLVSTVFSNSPNSFCIGNLTGSDNIPLNVNASILDNFLYLQSDVLEERQSFFEKVSQYNNDNKQKTVVLDFDNLTDYANVKVVDLCGDFKLPVSNEILDYIYENDLTGLTVEQKTIVQDIILEIRDYISTLETGFIPFNTLLDVVNGVYESDKSTGIILLRNKLLKYQQLNIFASEPSEIISLTNAIEGNTVTVFNLSKAESNWQKEAVKFLLENVEEKLYLVANITDDNIDTKILETIYKQENIFPVVSSGYGCTMAQQLKSLAKNLVLFRPNEQQKSFASYNSFLSKLAPKEFIVSGETTFFTPLIVKEFCDVFELNKQVSVVPQAQVASDQITEVEPLAEIDSAEQESFLAEDVELSLEDEIAKDVDKMFYGNSETVSENIEESGNLDEAVTESDLDMLDNMNFADTDVIEELSLDLEEPEPTVSNEQAVDFSEIDILSDDVPVENLELVAGQEQQEAVVNNEENLLDLVDDSEELPGFSELNPHEEDTFLVDSSSQSVSPVTNIQKQESSIPVYKPEIESESISSVKITVGNIVYHEKFGKGVVEEIFQHGNKVFCAIIFDKVGRRLLDPNVADIKQV